MDARHALSVLVDGAPAFERTASIANDVLSVQLCLEHKSFHVLITADNSVSKAIALLKGDLSTVGQRSGALAQVHDLLKSAGAKGHLDTNKGSIGVEAGAELGNGTGLGPGEGGRGTRDEFGLLLAGCISNHIGL